jgi:hypothetical protein
MMPLGQKMPNMHHVKQHNSNRQRGKDADHAALFFDVEMVRHIVFFPLPNIFNRNINSVRQSLMDFRMFYEGKQDVKRRRQVCDR